MRKKQKTTGLKFQTVRDEKRSRSRKIWLIFALVVLLIASGSLFIYLNSIGFFDEDLAETQVTNMKKEVTVMVSSDDSKGELVYVSWVTLNTKNNSFDITAVSPNAPYAQGTLKTVYKGDEASALQLKSALEKTYQVQFDRYIMLPESAYPKLLNKLGRYETYLPKPIEYRCDKYDLNLLEGNRILPGYQFFDYLYYLEDHDSNIEAQARLMAQYLQQILTPKNAEDAQALFESLCNYWITDVTAADFANYTPFFTACGDKETVNISVRAR